MDKHKYIIILNRTGLGDGEIEVRRAFIKLGLLKGANRDIDEYEIKYTFLANDAEVKELDRLLGFDIKMY